MKTTSRRKFLKGSVAAGGAAAGLSLLTPKQTQAQNARSTILGANDRIRVALIGCGGQGSGDLRAMLRIKNIECVALCEHIHRQGGDHV